MKEIRVNETPIVRLYCLCDSEYVEFSLPRDREEESLIIKINGEKNLSFRTRLRDSLTILKNNKKFENNPWFGLMIDRLDPIQELFGELHRSLVENDVLNKDDLDYILDDSIPLPQKFYDDVPTDEGKDGMFVFFKSNDGFTLSIEGREYEDKRMKAYWFQFGWVQKTKFRQIMDFLFKSRNYYIQDNEFYLNKSEVVELLKVLNYFSSKYLMDEWLSINGTTN